MITIHEHFVVDEDGRRTAVLLDIEEYNKLLQELEELESIRAYDATKSSGDEAIPFEQAIEEIEYFLIGLFQNFIRWTMSGFRIKDDGILLLIFV